jgi:hypothetical protein
MICLFDRHTSNHNTLHLNRPLHILLWIASPKDSMLDDTPPRLEEDCLAKVPLHSVRSYSLIPSFSNKPSGPHYLSSLSPSFVVSATPWGSEWMKHLHTAVGLALLQDQEVRMSPRAWWRLKGLFWSSLVSRSPSLFTLASQRISLPYG